MLTMNQSLKELTVIPGVGKSIASDLWNIGIRKVTDLKGRDPEVLYGLSNKFACCVQDRCLLHTFNTHSDSHASANTQSG